MLDDLHQLSNSTLIGRPGPAVELSRPTSTWCCRPGRTRPSPGAAIACAAGDRDPPGRPGLRRGRLGRLLERITGRPLGPTRSTALVDRTEGWAAGLQLAGMMLRLHDDPDAFVAHFSGTDRLIADYLSEEVLEAQPDAPAASSCECRSPTRCAPTWSAI